MPGISLAFRQPTVHHLQYCAAEEMTNYTQFCTAQIHLSWLCLCDYITDGRGLPWDQNAICMLKYIYKRVKPNSTYMYICSSTLLRVVNRGHTNAQGRKYHVVFLRCYDNSSTIYGTTYGTIYQEDITQQSG